MIRRAIKIEAPLMRPSGKPFLRIPIANETIAATKSIIFIVSLKFSIMSMHKVLIFRGGNLLTPNTYSRSPIVLGFIPDYKSVLINSAKPSYPPSSRNNLALNNLSLPGS
jgi:hypothetical protein